MHQISILVNRPSKTRKLNYLIHVK